MGHLLLDGTVEYLYRDEYARLDPINCPAAWIMNLRYILYLACPNWNNNQL